MSGSAAGSNGELLSCGAESLPRAIAGFLKKNRPRKSNLYLIWKNLKEREMPDSVLVRCVRIVLDSTAVSFSDPKSKLTNDEKADLVEMNLHIIRLLKDKNVPLEDLLSIFRELNKILAMPCTERSAAVIRCISIQGLRKPGSQLDDCVSQEIALWHWWYTARVNESAGWFGEEQKGRNFFSCALLKSWSSRLTCSDPEFACRFICALIKYTSLNSDDVFDVLSNLELESPLKAAVQVLSQRRVEDAYNIAKLESVHREFITVLNVIVVHFLSVLAGETKGRDLWCIAEVSFSILNCFVRESSPHLENILLLLRHVLYHRGDLSPEKLGQLCKMVADLGEHLPLSEPNNSLWGKESIAKFANSITPIIKDCADPATGAKIVAVFIKITCLRMSIAPSSTESLRMLQTALSLLEFALYFEPDYRSRCAVPLPPRGIFDLLKLYGPDNMDPFLLTASVATLRHQDSFLCDFIDVGDPDTPKWLALEVYALLRLHADEKSISYVKDRFTEFAKDEVHRAIMVIMDIRVQAQCKANIGYPQSKTEDNPLIEAARRGITFGIRHMQLSEAACAEIDAIRALTKEKPKSDHESVEQIDKAELNTDLPIALETLCHGNMYELFKTIRGFIDNFTNFKSTPYWVLLSTFILDDMRTAAAFYAINGDYGNQLKVLACLNVLLLRIKAPETQIIENQLRIFEALLFTGCIENARVLLGSVESRISGLKMYSEDFFYFETRIERYRVFLSIEENGPSPPETLEDLKNPVRSSSREKLRLYSIQRYYHGKALHQWNLNRPGCMVSTDCLESSARNLTSMLLKLREKKPTMTSWEQLELSYLLLKSDSLRSDVTLDRLTVYNTIFIVAEKSIESQRALSVYSLLDDLERMIRLSLSLETSLDSKMSLISALIDPSRVESAVKAPADTSESEEPFALRKVDSIPYRTALYLKMKQHQTDVAQRRVPAKEFLKFSKRRTHKKECRCHLCLSIGIGLMLKRIDAVTSGTTKQEFVPPENSVFARLESKVKSVAKTLNLQVHPETCCERVVTQIQILHTFHLAQGYAADGNFNESLRTLKVLDTLPLSPEEKLEFAVREFEYTYQMDWQAALSALGVYSNSPVEMMPPPVSGAAFKTPAIARKKVVKNVPARRRFRFPVTDSESGASGDEDAPEKKVPKKAEEENPPEAVETKKPRRACVTRAQKASSDQDTGEPSKPMFIPMEDLKRVNTRRRKMTQDLVLPRFESASRKIESVDDLFDDDEEMSFLETFSKMSFKDRLKKPKEMNQSSAEQEFRKLIEMAQGCALLSKQCLVTDLFQCLAFLSAHRKQTLESIFYLERSLGIGVQIAALNRGSRMKEFFDERILASEYFGILRPTIEFSPTWFDRMWCHLDRDWLVVQLSSIMEGGTTPGLLAVRYEYGHPPSTVHLSSKHDVQFQGSLFKHFDDLQVMNKATLRNEDIKTHWERRYRGDHLLQQFCSSLENSWMGCWKGFFRAAISGPQKILIAKVMKRVTDFAESQNLTPDERMLYIGLQGLDVLQIDQLTAMLVKVLGARASADIDQVHAFAQSLISTEERDALAKARRKPMILILDKYLINLPFDNCPLFSKVEQTRMPSVPFTVAHALLMNKRRRSRQEDPFTLSDPLKGFYVVNPGHNLPACQERFSENMRSLVDLWQGTLGEPMNRENFQSCLQSKSVYLYIGHGTGRQHMKASMEVLNIRAVVLLFGCSSAKMRRMGSKMDSEGYALRILSGGSPAVLGNLWDVTDKDIDLLTHTMLRMWLYGIFPDHTDEEPQFGAALNKARSVCKLKALNGGAPVIYGLPCRSFPP